MTRTETTTLHTASSALTTLRRRFLLLLALGGLTAVFTGCNSSSETGSYPTPSARPNAQVQSLIAAQEGIERENWAYQNQADAEISHAQHEDRMREIEMSNGNPYMN